MQSTSRPSQKVIDRRNPRRVGVIVDASAIAIGRVTVKWSWPYNRDTQSGCTVERVHNLRVTR